IPTALLEAASCGCAIVSTANCAIPEFIENGVNGYCTNDLNQMRLYLQELLQSPQKCRQMGEKARETVKEKFGMNQFVHNWNQMFKITANMIYKGEYFEG